MKHLGGKLRLLGLPSNAALHLENKGWGLPRSKGLDYAAWQNLFPRRFTH